MRAHVWRTRAVISAFLFFALSVAQLHAQLNNLTTNLLVNPGAEAGNISGWTVGGDGTPVADNGTFDSGITPHTGTYDFLGHDGAAPTLSQTVQIVGGNVTTNLIDGGTLYANLSFWEQGLSQGTPSDSASVTLAFVDSDGATISTVNSGEQDNHAAAWGNFSNAYPLPVGTRSITYTMTFVRHQGSDNDAFVDDNVLRIATTDGLQLSAKSVSFGNETVGGVTAPQVVTATNPNATTVNIAQIALDAGANPSEFAQTNNCPAALVQNASCQISLTFTPHSVGFKTAGVLIDTDSIPSQQGINVDGTGLGGILQVNPGNLKTIAGNGTAGYSGDGGQATAAEFTEPGGIAFDPAGNLYITDVTNSLIRKVDTSGNISTFAGTGAAGYSGDGGPATSAQLHTPFTVNSDTAGNIYIQDTGNYVIRKVNTQGIITTFAGTGTPGHAGDGGPAINARFNQNQGARFDKAGNLYVPQCLGASVRKIDTSGNISTVAGNFTEGFSGDGGPAINAQLQCPSGVTIDAAGNLYIADDFNNRIRKVDTAGIITTIAGGDVEGSAGDGGLATAAQLNLPNDVQLDAAGNLYIADSANNRVRKIDTNGMITTAAGGLNNAGSAGVNTPLNVTVDATGNLFFSDSGNNAVREVFPAGVAPFPPTPVGTAATPQTVTLSNIGNVPITIASASSFSLSGNSGDFTLSGGSCLAGVTLPVGQGSCTLQISFTPAAVGARVLTVSIVDDALNSPQSFTVSGTGAAGAPTLTWTPPANITYGTPLSATQLDATATGTGGTAVAGTFVYTPAAGTVLGVGTQTLSVVFTSTDPSYTTATATVPLTVTQATPTIAWATPASIAYGVPLTAAQLNAAATGVGGLALPGTFTYTPLAGTVLSPGTQTLNVAFSPTDTVDYTVATGAVQLLVTGLKLVSFTPAAAKQGDPSTTITLTGSGFVPNSVVLVNGTAVATTYINLTTLTAVIPAANLTQTGTLQIAVSDPSIEAVSAAQPFAVIPATTSATLTGPSTTPPGSQPTVTLTINEPYPLPITAVFTLTFAGGATPPVDDPAIQFADGGRTFTVVIPANSTTIPAVELQSGTDAGTITIPVVLTADGLDITPTTLAPLTIVVPPAVPVLSSATITRSGKQVTVAVHGFSNTREVMQADFHFKAATNATITKPDFMLPATTLFGGWYSSEASTAYGSTFTYTQIFDVSDDAASIGSVDVTVTNSVGTSNSETTP